MFEKFARSWSLVKASAAVLRADKELLWFPVISSIAAMLVAATFLVPSFLSGLFDGGAGPISIVVGFLFYVTQFTVIFFFNSALVGAALIRLEGGDPTVADGLRIARERFGAIVGYAVIAAVVGLLIKALEERSEWLGAMVARLLGAAWTVSTFLVVPVLVAQNVGPIDAIKESFGLLRKSWGENLIGNVGLGFAFGLLTLVVILLGAGLIVAAALTAGATAAIAIGVVVVIAVIALAVTQAALAGIYQAAVYRFAVDGQAPVGFDGAALQGAFRHK
ncbi:DUF6159 family protein [Silanimonas sp.]|jgi:hypothetical protein|uniref:DUF6159 family protein n=1 Tax=Silanimonas sp. TaxID=1929290 RepID=UPI0037C53DB0